MNQLLTGDSLTLLRTLPDNHVDCVVTSPPYWGLRDYGIEGQLGLEKTFEEYLAKLSAIFAELRRVLKPSGTAWVNMGDCYAHGACGGADVFENGRTDGRANGKDRARGREKSATMAAGLKPKDLVGQPWRLAFALRDQGWWLRQDIIWHKPSAMPESVTDRCTRAHEYIFMFSKSARYFYDAEAIKTESLTNDPRTPYGSQGAWDLDGRPKEQQHGGKIRKALRSKKDSFAREQETPPGQKPQHRADREDIDYNTGANRRSVWTIASTGYPGAHFATFPRELAELCIRAGCPIGGIVCDIFGGSGTVAEAALLLNRNYILMELNPKYVELQQERLAQYPILTAVNSE